MFFDIIYKVKFLNPLDLVGFKVFKSISINFKLY